MDRLEVAIEAARAAGDYLKEVCASNRYTTYQERGQSHDFKYSTSADLKANEIIKGIIKKNYSGDGWLSEEEKESLDDLDKRVQKEYCWIIDPMDGTHDFRKKGIDYSVCIGVSRDGKSDMGVMYFPERDEMFYSQSGSGAFMNGTPIEGINSGISLRNCVFVASENEYNHFKGLRRMFDDLDCKEKLFVPTISNKMSKILKMEADIYASFGSPCEWDICAGHTLLEETGRTITDFEGNRIMFNKQKPLAEKGLFVTSFSMPDHYRVLNQLKKYFTNDLES